MTTTTKSLHPLVLAAAVAVLLFCGVGTAALMGWLPSSDSRDAQPLSSAASSEQLASLQAIAPPPGAQALDAAPLASQQPPQQLAAVQAAPAPRPLPEPEPQYAAAPAPKVCSNCGVIEAIHEVNTRASGSGVGAAGGDILFPQALVDRDRGVNLLHDRRGSATEAAAPHAVAIRSIRHPPRSKPVSCDPRRASGRINRGLR